MPKLTDTQLILLSTAAQRANGSLLPVSDSPTADVCRVASSVAALIKRGLAVEANAPDAAQAIRTDDDRHVGAVITDAGRLAIGVEVESDQPDAVAGAAPVLVRQTKAALVLQLLTREQGATLAELIEATGWQAHTVRAALTGLRKKSHAVEKRKRDDATCYQLVAAA